MTIYLTFSLLVALIASASLTTRVMSSINEADSMYEHTILTSSILFMFYFLLSPLVMFVLFSTDKANVFCDVLGNTLKD
jgi:hypothetical protein